MSRMKNLRTLTTFVVGKHTGSRVGELRDLSHLSGTLAIFKLKNVADARDALESNMKGKECLDKLELNWEDDNAIAGDSHDAASVLEKLQPHSNLKELSIGCYYGAKFSSWLGEPSFINMVRLQLYSFFTKLETLNIWGCTNLESLYIPDGVRNMDLTSLQSIYIWDCPNLVSFPQGGLPASNLRSLWIRNCMKLKSLPQRMHTLLTSLDDLWILDCPEIVSFPEGDLPTNLSSLEIWNCYKLMESQKEWGLQTLPSLRYLTIRGGTEEGLESFSEEWLLLPSTLFSFSIFDFPDLKSLDNLGLQNLTSLEALRIVDCVKLKSFPKQGLPSLSVLEIHKCPLLKKRCQRDKGKEWRKIAHIPKIVMDAEVIVS
eukprot:XP_019076539.1 PREDICTED: putative disease resistance protein At3g14460 [Vitis vinifera]